MVKFDKEFIATGAGCGIAVIQTVLTKEYIDPQFGPIPVIGDYLPYPWGNWSTFGNILIGGIAFGLSTFTGLVDRNYDVKKFLQVYGIGTLIGGLINGIFPTPALRARAAVAPRLVATANRMTPLTPTGIPAAKVLA